MKIHYTTLLLKLLLALSVGLALSACGARVVEVDAKYHVKYLKYGQYRSHQGKYRGRLSDNKPHGRGAFTFTGYYAYKGKCKGRFAAGRFMRGRFIKDKNQKYAYQNTTEDICKDGYVWLD